MTETPLTPVPHKQMHPRMQFLILLGLFLGLWIAGNILGGAIVASRYGLGILQDISKENMAAPNVVPALWILQFFSATLPILLTPVIFSYSIVREPGDYMKNNFHFPWLLMVIVFLTMMLANPLIEFLGNINQKLPLPHWMFDEEKSLEKVSNTMMQMNSFGQMIFNLLFIGLLTAVVEEILFRGCFQTVLFRWTKNTHVAVWLTAIVFSAVHMEFLGFIPRMLLGLLFGYFTAWSGSVWPAIWAHFINNGTVVVVTYLYQNKMITLNPDQNQNFNNTAYLVSFIITLFLLFIYWYLSNKWHAARYGEELD